MKPQELAVRSFHENQKLLSAVNTLSINAKLEMAGRIDLKSEKRVAEAKRVLKSFFEELDVIVQRAEETEAKPLLGVDARRGEFVRNFIAAKRNLRIDSRSLNGKLSDITQLIYSDEENDKKEILLVLEELRTLLEEHIANDTEVLLGGASCAYAFSMYLRILGRAAYHLPVEKLERSSHPVPWIHIHLLADRADSMGYNAVATDLEEKWSQIATALGVTEDYGGFYDPSFLRVIQEKLDDMLTETSPREFMESEVSNYRSESAFTSPVALLNMAWQKFLDDPGTYREWEENAMESFLDADL